MKFSEYGQKLEMSDMYTPEEKHILGRKLMEAKEKMKALKKAQALKMKKKDKKVEEATGFTATDKRKGKVDTSTKSQYSVKLMHKDGSKTKNVSYDADEGESEGDVRDRASRDHKSQGYSVDSIRKKTQESKKSKKDYDGDGKVETPKDEVWGSRAKAAAKSGKPFKEAAKPDYIDLDKDGNKKEPMKKAAKDKKVKETAISGAPQKSGIPATAKTTVPGMRANQQDLKKANSSAALGEGKCNHTPKGKSCPIHGLKECSTLKEGYTLQKTNVTKNFVPGYDDEVPDSEYDNITYKIVNNRTGKVVGTATRIDDPDMRSEYLEITVNGRTRNIPIYPSEDPQAALNRFLKDKKTSKKYTNDVAESWPLGPDKERKADPVTMRHKTSGKEIVVDRSAVESKKAAGFEVVKSKSSDKDKD